jgi:hypothetical protein
MKYFMVRTEECVSTRQCKLIHTRTEIVEAEDSSAVYEDCLNRFGKNLISMDAREIERKSIDSNTRIYAVI